jgi:hypothetical protein
VALVGEEWKSWFKLRLGEATGERGVLSDGKVGEWIRRYSGLQDGRFACIG